MKRSQVTMLGPMADRPRKPRGLLRLAFRLPVFMYRCRLGWLLGHRFLRLTHRGRRTGAMHETVLEVLHYDPAMRESIVFSGRGARADWYRNIEAHPALAVRTGRQCYVPEHRVLDHAEVAAVSARFAREHPRETRLIAPILRRLDWAAGDVGRGRAFPRDSILVAFWPHIHANATDIRPR